MRRRPRSVDLSLRLSCWEDLFRTPEPHLFPLTGRLQSGIEELIAELRARPLPKQVRTTLILDPDPAPVDEQRIRDVLGQYLALRLHDLALELRAHRRQERQSLIVGGVLFLLGIGLSAEFTQSGWPIEVQSLLGDGIFLVLAWVGLWYPLDYYIFDRRPLVRDRKVLRVMRAMDVTVRREASESGSSRGSSRPAEELERRDASTPI